MADDTVTLNLQGEVSLAVFAKAVAHFSALVDALSRDVAGHPELRWVITELEAGSALATARGLGDVDAVESVTAAFIGVGNALERGIEPPYPTSIRHEALALASMIDGEVELIRFETARAEAIVQSSPRRAEEAAPGIPTTLSASRQAYGGVQGRVQTLFSRGGLRFTLFDTLFDRAVSCYLEEGQEDIMRDVWGRVAVVEGVVSRDQTSGRPQTVRNVRRVTVVRETTPDAYRATRGLLRPATGNPQPEVTIRALRDA